ncbi:MAG TPA: radical SAM protein [Ignavibacteriaceae bacterium]|nr:radical SAM protein [Ignavibacteriaceae bacterium]
MQRIFSTIDFHITCECNQDCPYCWGPQNIKKPVSISVAKSIIKKIKDSGARRIVFTGGDPLKRKDLGEMIRYAKESGLEVALSTTGDSLTSTFLRWYAPYIDLISLPIDGSTEEISSKTKEAGHLTAVLKALNLLKRHPHIDVKLCTPVTKYNIKDIPNILSLAENYKSHTASRVFYNIFQTFPRSFSEVNWGELIVSNREFVMLKRKLSGRKKIKVNFLSHTTLDKLYLMVFPNGNLVIPEGENFTSFGPFLKIEDINEAVNKSNFDSSKHLKHSKGWMKKV